MNSRYVTLFLGFSILGGCAASEAEIDENIESIDQELQGHRNLTHKLRHQIAYRGIEPTVAAPVVSSELYDLGQALAFDKLLSGNRNISCMTCHHSDIGTDDDRALPLGQGGVGLGANRTGGPIVPRSAPALFNLHTLDQMFWDGRVQHDQGGGFDTPAGAEITPEMEAVFEFGVVSAQAMFPVTSGDEMRGEPGDNEIADAPTLTVVWQRLMARIGAVPQYVAMFEAAYPGQDFDDMTFAHAANAIAGFEIAAFTSYDSPWEDFLHGDDHALTRREKRGALAFFQKGCANCHSGSAFSDGEFHNTGLAQFGPGKGNGTTGTDDFGRINVTGQAEDLYAFRTPPLVNIELTGPYGHDGQYSDLRKFVGHYRHPVAVLANYDITEHVDDSVLWSMQLDNFVDVVAALDPATKVYMRRRDVRRITKFLKTLTAESARNLTSTVPSTVPSGLPVAD